MEKENEKYQTLAHFWDEAFKISLEDEDEILKNTDSLSWQDCAPSKELFRAVQDLKSQNNVLDYGCGSGWGAIVALKSGIKQVTAVDVSANSIKLLNLYKKAYNLDNLKALVIDENWIKSIPNESFDGLICSNVLDVLPLKMTMELIENFARILKPKAKVVIGLNFYITNEMQNERGFHLENDELYVNGVLRLLNKKDSEWKNLFSKYFEIESLSYFAWKGEAKPTRRLFILSLK